MTVNVFDANFYAAANPDLAVGGITTAEQLSFHFQTFGIDEGRRFSRLVDLDLYRSRNPDLAGAGITGNRQVLDHLQFFGVAEGRQFSQVLDVNFYGGNNPDLAAAGFNNEDLFRHFQNFGINEGRASAANFDVTFYLNNNPDLQAAGFSSIQALEHYLNFGLQEGRIASPAGGSGSGSELNAAVDIDVLTGTRTLTGSISDADPADIYRFSLAAASNFSAVLDGLSADADVDIIQDFNGNGAIDFEDIIDASLNGGTTSEEIAINPLNTGIYFVRVFQASGDTDYNLNLSATPV